MLDHDKAIENAWKKAERIEKEMEVKRKKRKKFLVATGMIAAACVLGLIGWKNVRQLKPDKNVSGKNNTLITMQPTENLLNPQQNQPTSTPTRLPKGVIEVERPSNIFIMDKEGPAVLLEEINAGPGEIVIGSQSLQKALDETGDEEIYYPVEIRFCFQKEVTQDCRKELIDSEVLRIRNQGVYIEKMNEEGVDVLVSKKQIEGLQQPDICGYLLGWTR